MNLHWTREEARLFHLFAVGLLGKEYPKAKAGIRQAFDDLGTLQLDPLPIMGRSHDLVIQARVDGTHPNDALDLIHKERLGFEYWDKVYCAVPIEHFPTVRARMAAGHDAWYRERERLLTKKAPDALKYVYQAVEIHGPVSSRELKVKQVGQEEYRGWKSTTAANAALDVLWNNGKISVSHRVNNRKYFDLTERVIPKALCEEQTPSLEQFKKSWLIKRVRNVGLLPINGDQEVWASVRDFRVNQKFEKLVKKDELALIEIEGVRTKCLAPPDAEEMLERAKSARTARRAKFISPLDPFIWSRKLVSELWDFDYVWEVYKPKRQRIWGYYVLPVIYQDRIVARFDGKYEQKSGKLIIASYHEESGGLPMTHASIESAFERFLGYLGGEKIKLPRAKTKK